MTPPSSSLPLNSNCRSSVASGLNPDIHTRSRRQPHRLCPGLNRRLSTPRRNSDEPLGYCSFALRLLFTRDCISHAPYIIRARARGFVHFAGYYPAPRRSVAISMSRCVVRLLRRDCISTLGFVHFPKYYSGRSSLYSGV